MNEDEVLEFRRGELEVHCQRIEFVQRASAEPRCLAGPGRIYQQPDGTIRVTAYPESFPRRRREDLPLGTAIPEDQYWDLIAEDPTRRRRWCADRVYLDLDGFGLSWGPIDQPLRSLRREDTRAQSGSGAHFTGYIFRRLAIDANARTDRTMTRPSAWSEGGRWNILRFPTGDLQVEIREEAEAEYSVIDVASDGPLPDHFEQRLLEAVRFVFGRPVSWSATVQTFGGRQVTRLRGSPVHDLDTHFRQVIPHNVVGAREWMSELLRRYYVHVARDTGPGWHRLSIWWSEVLRAGSREMESLCLVASVAVEGVCRAIIEAEELPPGIETVSAEDAQQWRRTTAAELERLQCPERIRRRVNGVFSKMAQIGAWDVLAALERLGAVDRDLVELWKAVRNDAAHGAGGRWGSAAQISADADGLVTLLRQLTFWWIGYRGWYQHLDPKGWRMREYPPPAPQ